MSKVKELLTKWEKEYQEPNKQVTSIDARLVYEKTLELCIKELSQALTEDVAEIERLLDGIKIEHDYMGEFGAFLVFEKKAPKDVKEKFRQLDKHMLAAIKNVKKQALEIVNKVLK